jgi:hypothetical protein
VLALRINYGASALENGPADTPAQVKPEGAVSAMAATVRTKTVKVNKARKLVILQGSDEHGKRHGDGESSGRKASKRSKRVIRNILQRFSVCHPERSEEPVLSLPKDLVLLC